MRSELAQGSGHSNAGEERLIMTKVYILWLTKDDESGMLFHWSGKATEKPLLTKKHWDAHVFGEKKAVEISMMLEEQGWIVTLEEAE